MATDTRRAIDDGPSRSAETIAPEHPRRSVLPPRMATVLVGAGGVVAVVTLAMRSPHVPGSYAVCPSLALFGVYCPGCGSLRAVHEVANGDIAGAWDMNPLAVLLLPFFAWAYVAWVRRSWFGATKKRLLPGWAVRAVGVAIIAYGMLRNVPALEPFLAP